MKKTGYCYSIPQSSANRNLIRAYGLPLVLLMSVITGCTKYEYTVDSESSDKITPTVVSVTPVNESRSVPTILTITVAFSEKMDTSTINKSNFTLRKGTLVINGTLTCTETTATFTPMVELEGNTIYNMIVTKEVKDAAGNPMTADYTWSFTTQADVTAPAVSSILPASNATAVQTNIKPTVTFSEPMNITTITTATFLLKQGTSNVAGTVTISGNTATFSPTGILLGNTQYTCTITNAVKDAAGNPIAAPYSWKFTTGIVADITPPSVSSITPSSNAINVAVTIKPTITFSEPMNISTISASTILLKQGTTNIAGTVSMSGNIVTYTPVNTLNGNTVYTISVTTGVKDAAGNPLASNYSSTFTTISTLPVAKSFATDVMPILNICNTCHTHGWTPSTTASTFHANLVSGGYINLTTPTSGKIYNKLSGGHPSSTVTAAQKATVLTWIQEGSKNN
jgi:hypothetical protein